MRANWCFPLLTLLSLLVQSQALPSRSICAWMQPTIMTPFLENSMAMLNTYKEAAKIGYNATQFFHMVNENGGVETAHILLSKDPADGFRTLWKKNRLIFQLKL